MRYPAEETAAKHRRLLDVAASMIRERGIEGVSVNDVMKAAGMTHGAFYAHFGSKDDLTSAALKEAMDQSDAKLEKALADPADPKTAFLDSYLSRDHRDHCGTGCPITALAVEIARRKKDKPALSKHIAHLIDRIMSGFRWEKRGSKRDQAILMSAAIVGAVVLARSVSDRAFSDEILAATKRQLMADS